MDIERLLTALGFTLVAMLCAAFLVTITDFTANFSFTRKLINSVIDNNDILDAIYLYYDRNDLTSRILKKIYYKKMQTIESMIILYKLTN